MAFLELKNLSKSYAETPVLRDINLTVEKGEFLVLLGFSGTGKTTLINLMAGLELPTKGEVLFKGQPVTEPGPERGVIFQNYSLMPWLTVTGNVALAVDTIFPAQPKAERAAKVARYVAMVGLSHAAARRPAELSGGMRQRVNVARALAMDPELLLLDEPLSALDALTRANLAQEIEKIWEADRKTCVLITNDVDEAILLADRVVMMTNGPRATIGKVTEVKLPRPRSRKALLEHPDYYAYRQEVLDFLEEYEHGHQPKTTPGKTPKPKAGVHAQPKAVAAE